MSNKRKIKGGAGVAHRFQDYRIVTGANCSWWGSISEVGTAGSGLPVCPQCGSPLFEVESEAVWWAQVDRFIEANPDREMVEGITVADGYRDFIEWGRGKCFPGREGAGVTFGMTVWASELKVYASAQTLADG